MSLKDLLSPELYDEVVHDAHDSGEEIVKKENGRAYPEGDGKFFIDR